MKLRRSVACHVSGRMNLNINGKPKLMSTNDCDHLLALANVPIPGPCAMWYLADYGLVCIGQVGAWMHPPMQYGRWAELWPVFESYVRMMSCAHSS
jgi:hypothetical protein